MRLTPSRSTEIDFGGWPPRTTSLATRSCQTPLPSSTKHLLILELEVGPGELRETYRQSTRLLLLPAGDNSLRLDCRYRLFRRHAADGSPLPWLKPSDLFPGAARIVHHD